MPTPSEQKALAFMAIIIVLGGAVRVLRASSPPTATPAEQQAIGQQAQAAESASAGAKERKITGKRARVSSRRRNDGANVIGGVSSVPRADVRPGSSSDHDRGADLSARGFPPPAPRIDTDNRLRGKTTATQPGPGAGNSPPPVDVDLASAAELETLPRVGPALAARIVASRDSLGPFGSLEALGRVRGIGPAMLRQLRLRVTFSGRAASSGDRSRY